MEKERVFDIGGVYVLELVKSSSGYHGHYKVVRTGQLFSFDGTGLSQTQILKKFWDKAKRYQEVSA